MMTDGLDPGSDLRIMLRLLFPPAFPEAFSRAGREIDPRLEKRLAAHVANDVPLNDGEPADQSTVSAVHESACREVGRLLSTGSLVLDSAANAWVMT